MRCCYFSGVVIFQGTGMSATSIVEVRWKSSEMMAMTAEEEKMSFLVEKVTSCPRRRREII